jgi:hypothetical protein
LHNEVGDSGDLQSAATRSGRAVDDQQVVLGGDFKGLRCRGKCLRSNRGLNACIEPVAVPVNGRPLLCIEVRDLGLEAAD